MMTSESLPTILIVEDDASVRRSIVAYLEDRGFGILEAENGAVGLEVFRRNKPDVILLDLRMPVMDGLEALSHVTRESPDTPVVVISGTGAIANAVEALHRGAWDYLLKPIEHMDILLHGVQTVLERAELIRKNREYREGLEKQVAERTAELAATQADLISAQRLAHVGNWTWDVHSGEVTWSDEIFRIFGLDPATFTPQIDSIMAITHPDDGPLDKELIARAIECHEPGVYEQRIFRPDGSVRTFTSTFEGQYDEQGNLVRIVGTAHDITERKRAEQERERTIAELEAKNAELERYTYTVSHDLKGPLITIKGFLGMLAQDMADGKTKQVQDDLKSIAGAADRMLAFLNDLLELSRVGRLASEPEDVAMEALVAEAVGLLGGAVHERGAQIIVAPDLPTLFGDRRRLVEVFQNLIENAVKYAGDRAHPRIEIGAERQEKQIVCRVRDNGRGIDPRYHERIFGLFEQIDPTGEGTGVGLALVRRIVEVHGGRIWVESEGEGKGATFFLTLPSQPRSSVGEPSRGTP
ncbi:MAG: response regulator [Pirellulales bacterium]|nr:response regulator [Pirellulales bacterium]